MTRYRFPGRTCKNSSTRKRVKGFWSVTEEAVEAEQIYRNLVAWKNLVGSSDDEDFLGFTKEDEQLARSTAVIEAHSLELESGELLGKSGKKKDNAKASTSVSKQKRPLHSSSSSEPACTLKSNGAKIETESTVTKNPTKSDEKSKKEKLNSESTSYFSKNSSKSTRLLGKKAGASSGPDESPKISILKPSTLKFESFSSGHTLGANWMRQSTPSVKPTSLPDAKKCIVCETMTTEVQCDSCRRFVEKMTAKTTQKLMCHRGRGVCKVAGIEVRARCPACWLMLCLSKLPVPQKTLTRLRKFLPSSLQYHVGPGIPVKKDPLRGWSDNVSNQTQLAARALMKKAAKTANSKIKETTNKVLIEVEKPKRQKSQVKGPRIKHVCRRACVVLGQPQATFPSPSKFTTLDIFKKYSEPKHKEKKVPSKAMVEVPQEKVPAPAPQVPGASSLPLEMLGLPAAAPAKAEPPAGWICVDFEATEASGVPVMSAIGTSNLPPALCILCGSAGKEELLFCAMCCEPYHIYCLSTNPQMNKMWVCERCELCGSCNKPTMNDSEVMRCHKCVAPFHKNCLTSKPIPGKPWECPACNVCRSCGTAAPVMKSAGNSLFCPPCYKLRLKGNYCPHCQQCYKDDDYDTKMVECAQCLSWVHATCEGISDEKYQILSYLPETVEFLCKICTPEVPALWSQAIDNEISNGIMNIVKNLAKYRSIKLSPNKRVTCEVRDESTKKLDKPVESKSVSKCDNKIKDKPDATVKKPEKVEERLKTGNPKKADPPAEPIEPEPAVESKKPEPEVADVKKEEIIRVKPLEEIKQEPAEKDPLIEAAKMKLDFEEGRLPQLVVKLTDCVKQKAKATQTLKLKQIQEAYNIRECSVHLRKVSDEAEPEPIKNIISLPSTSKSTSTVSCVKPLPTIFVPTLKTPDKNANYDVSPNKMVSVEPVVSSSQTVDVEVEVDCADEKKNTSFIELEDETATDNQAVAVFESPSKIPESGTLDIKILATTLKKASLGNFKTIVSFDLEFKSEALKNKSDEIQTHYLQLISESFPWYKPGVLESSKDSDKQLVAAKKPAASIEKLETLKNLSQLYTSGFKDDRICAFCKKSADGIGNDLERMLHTGSAPPLDWVHANCALWSSEVWEDRDGYLHCVVPGALSRASRTKCGYCGEKGASVGCCQGNSCPNSYHWPCALELAKLGDAIFLDTSEMALYCTDHGESRKMMAELDAEEKDISLSLAFPLPRRLAVEPARNKKRYADPVCVEIAIGSIRVERLGLINSSLCYDETRDILVPIGYVAKRLFWSTKEPWRIVEYVIITELEMETTVEEGLARDINLTVEHGTHGAPPEVMEKNLRVLRHIQQQEIDLTRDNELGGRENADDLLLPPDLKETIFQDLNNELLEGISMQDIFTKLMSDDISKEDTSDNEENPVRDVVDFIVDQICLQESYDGKSRKRTRTYPLGLDDDYITPKAMKSSRGFRIPQFDGADDSSSDSESADKSDEVNVEVETSLTRKRSTMDSNSDEGPVKCISCKRTYRTKVSYDKHLASCTEVSSESSDESSESPTTSRVSTKTSKYGTVVVKTKLVVMQSPDKNQKRKREAKAVRKAVKLAAKPADSTTKTLIQQQPQQSINAHYHQHQQISTTMSDKPTFAPTQMYQEQAPQPIVMGQNPIYVTQPTVYYINVTPSKQNYLLLNSPDGQQNLVYVQGMEQEPSPIILPQGYGNMMLPSYNSNTTFLTQSPFLQNMAYSPMINDTPQLVNTPNGLFLSNPAAAQSPFTINQSPFITTSTPTAMQSMGHLLPNMGLSAHDLGPTFTPDLQIKQEPNPTIQIINPTLVQKSLEFQQPAAPAPPPPMQIQAPMQPPLINLNQYLAPPTAQQPQVPAFLQQPQQLRQPFIQMPNQNFVQPNGLVLKRQVNSTVTNIQKMQMISSSISPRTCQMKTATRSYVEVPPKPTEKVAPMPKILPNPPPLCVKEKPVKLSPSPAPPQCQQSDNDAPKVVKITASANVGTQTTPRCITPSIVKKEPTDVEEKTGIQFKIQSSDGFVTTAHNVSQAWQNIFDAVQTARKAYNLTPLPYNPFSLSGQQMTGLGQDPIKYLIEQLPGVTKCTDYTPKFHNTSQKKSKKLPLLQPKLNISGCARTESFKLRNPYDMFGWLASEHRKPPSMPLAENETANRSKTSSNLPMAMRFRQLKNNARVKVGVFRSLIHGRGLFCIRELEQTEMVIEYAGEVIRSIHTDRREKIYESRGIGCYMFRIDDDTVVDATMKGNAARFINHSCEPNCYSRVVDVLGKKHILIFALRRILPGEELTYDYKFPFEDDKIPCTCGSRRCRKYLN